MGHVIYKYTCPSSIQTWRFKVKIQSQSGFAKIKTSDSSQCHGGVRSGLLIPGQVRSIWKHQSVHSMHRTIDSHSEGIYPANVPRSHKNVQISAFHIWQHCKTGNSPSCSIHGEQLNMLMDGPPTWRHPGNLKISEVSPSMQLEKDAESLS